MLMRKENEVSTETEQVPQAEYKTVQLHDDVQLGPETRTVSELGDITNPVGVQLYTRSVALRVVLKLETESVTVTQ